MVLPVAASTTWMPQNAVRAPGVVANRRSMLSGKVAAGRLHASAKRRAPFAAFIFQLPFSSSCHLGLQPDQQNQKHDRAGSQQRNPDHHAHTQRTCEITESR